MTDTWILHKYAKTSLASFMTGRYSDSLHHLFLAWLLTQTRNINFIWFLLSFRCSCSALSLESLVSDFECGVDLVLVSGGSIKVLVVWGFTCRNWTKVLKVHFLKNRQIFIINYTIWIFSRTFTQRLKAASFHPFRELWQQHWKWSAVKDSRWSLASYVLETRRRQLHRCYYRRRCWERHGPC